jgi:hypothetical protein
MHDPTLPILISLPTWRRALALGIVYLYHVLFVLESLSLLPPADRKPSSIVYPPSSNLSAVSDMHAKAYEYPSRYPG